MQPTLDSTHRHAGQSTPCQTAHAMLDSTHQAMPDSTRHAGQHTPPRRTAHAMTLDSTHHHAGQHTPHWTAHATMLDSTCHAMPDNTHHHTGQHMPCHARQHTPPRWTAHAMPHWTAHATTLDSTRHATPDSTCHAGQHAPHRIAHTTRPTTSCFPLKIYTF